MVSIIPFKLMHILINRRWYDWECIGVLQCLSDKIRKTPAILWWGSSIVVLWFFFGLNRFKPPVFAGKNPSPVTRANVRWEWSEERTKAVDDDDCCLLTNVPSQSENWLSPTWSLHTINIHINTTYHDHHCRIFTHITRTCIYPTQNHVFSRKKLYSLDHCQALTLQHRNYEVG